MSYSEVLIAWSWVLRNVLWYDSCFSRGMRSWSIPLTIYRLVAIPGFLISVVTAIAFGHSHELSFLIWAMWTKVVTTGLLLLFVKLFRSSRFHYFHNLGYSTHEIYLYLVGVDFLLSGLLLFIAFLFL